MSNQEYKNLIVEQTGAAGVITINRPEVLNALDIQTLQEVRAAMIDLAHESSIRGIILTGAGTKAFVAGADIAHLSTLGPREAHQFSEMGERTLRKIETLEKPVIAAVNGFALGGGCELALACDVIIASSRARFGQPEVNLGVIPGFGGTQRLSRLIGKNLARYMCFTGDIFDADWAHRVQIAAEVVEPDALLPRCIEIVETIATKGPLAVAAAKRVIQMGFNLNLDTALEMESMAFSGLFATADLKEGMQAFLNKRKAEFKGE